MGVWALENAIISHFEATTCEGDPRKIKYQHCYSWNRGNNIRCRFDESFRLTHWVHLERRRFYQFCNIHLSTIVSKNISFWQIVKLYLLLTRQTCLEILVNYLVVYHRYELRIYEHVFCFYATCHETIEICSRLNFLQSLFFLGFDWLESDLRTFLQILFLVFIWANMINWHFLWSNHV